MKYLEESGASGETQWAFREGHSCRDLVALLTATWVLDLHAGKKIGVYLSDISGAFDRVESEMLLEKLKAAGLNEDTLLFLESYLQPRRATVLVTGAKSEERVLENSVFQGTRLGPPLWNVFFQDVSLSVPEAYKETKFADDPSSSKAFEKDTPNEDIHEDLKNCQASVHKWGRDNRVIFDVNKEAFVVIHGLDGEGDDFKCLGTWMDTNLRMSTNIQKMLARARPKVTALLRSRRYYDVKAMINQYKAHVLCLLEVNPGGFYHAVDTVLEPIEKLQDHYLKELDLSRRMLFSIGTWRR